jgi:AhpD family alkylhydroperoxidase
MAEKDLKAAFEAYRITWNEKIFAQNHKVINRFFSLDGQTYKDGALSAKTKEMLGLVASLVLRCDDCVRYHLIQCHEAGVTTEELFDILAVGNIVGGSICIPHTRRAVEFWESLGNVK